MRSEYDEIELIYIFFLVGSLNIHSGRICAVCNRCNISINIEIEQVSFLPSISIRISISPFGCPMIFMRFCFSLSFIPYRWIGGDLILVFFCVVELIKRGHKINLIRYLIFYNDQIIWLFRITNLTVFFSVIYIKCQTSESRKKEKAYLNAENLMFKIDDDAIFLPHHY